MQLLLWHYNSVAFTYSIRARHVIFNAKARLRSHSAEIFGTAALNQLGVLLEGVGSNANISLTADGRELGRYGHSTRIFADEKVGANSASGDRRKNVHLPRQALRRVLLERLSPEIIHWGKKFKNYNETMCSSSPGELQFEDGER